jgi:hypothetical protein
MLLNRSEKLALIHLAKKECALDDEAYRAILAGSAQVSSAAEIDSDEQFNAVMTAFGNLGFTRKPARQKRMPVQDSDIPGPKRATKRQLYYIKGLWELASRSKDEKSLKALVKRIGKVDDLRFLPRPTASKVILALRDICWKAGFNPDSMYEKKEGAGNA